jgi:nucleoside-diphosphate-sugar epimerase
MEKILVTGAFGQIGSDLVPQLMKIYGSENVISLGHKNIPGNFKGIVEILSDITDIGGLEKIIQKHQITTIYHLVSLLSAKGEINPSLTWEVNMKGLKNILDLSVKYKIKLFWPSSIAAFGPTTPRVNTPQKTVLEPTTMYGVTKVAGENLCLYYHKKFDLDVRSLRYPGLISYKAEPGGGTTDYAVAIFYEAILKGKYTCFVSAETILPMMYMDDAVKATIDLMRVDQKKISIRNSYNIAAISFKASELAEEINKHIKVEVDYQPDERQKIANSWPQTIDDSQARQDWNWQHEYDLSKMTIVMLEKLKNKIGK